MLSNIAVLPSKSTLIDRAQAVQHVELLAGDSRTPLTFQVFDDSPAKDTGKARIHHGTVTRVWPHLVAASGSGCGVFITVNETDFNGRARKNIIRVRAYFIDIDGAAKPDFALPPSLVLSRGPLHHHAYWLVEDGDLGSFTADQKRLAAHYGSDPAVSDLPRVLRLAGFPHQKDPENISAYRIVEATGHVYSRAKVLAAHPNVQDAAVVSTVPRDEPLNGDRPGDIYNLNGDHVELLTRNGWTLDHTEGQNEHWTRPGKSHGTSATWHTEKRTFYLFSSSVGELAPGQGHSLFAVRAAFEHANDHSACARAIRAEQYLVTSDMALDSGAAGDAPDDKSPRRLAVEFFTQTREEKPAWIWNYFIPRKCTSVLGGKQGHMKGLVTVDIAARLTRGDAMPDGSGGGKPGRVLFVTREDDPNMTLLPRLRVARADMNMAAWTHGDFTDSQPIATMAEAAKHVEEMVALHGFDLVIVDPLGSWVEDDMNNGQQVRAVIDPMNRMARRTGCAVLFVAHLKKGSSDDPMDAFSGSAQVVAAVRVATLLSLLSDTDRLVSVVKSNFKKPDGPLAFKPLRASEDHDDPPALEWRSANDEDRATAAANKNGAAQVVALDKVKPYMPVDHQSLDEVARTIRKSLLGTMPRLTVAAVRDAILGLVQAGEAYEGTGKHGARTVGLTPPLETETATDRAAAAWSANPTATVREIAALAMCSPALAGKAKPPRLSTGSVYSGEGEL
jgi:hypothetical protein